MQCTYCITVMPTKTSFDAGDIFLIKQLPEDTLNGVHCFTMLVDVNNI